MAWYCHEQGVSPAEFWELLGTLLAIDAALVAGMYLVVRRPLEKQLREMIRTLDRINRPS